MRKILLLSILFVGILLPAGENGREGRLRGNEPDREKGGIVSFSAEVASENAPICSSPGEENCYETGTLRAGDLVEIFFRTENGWCAIKPPEGSFSWINADYVNQRDQKSGVVVCPENGKEVPVRVGADSVLKSSGVQVGLKNGRPVRILGEITLSGGKRWLKIAPPSGEFRWIHQDQLVADPFLSQIPNQLTKREDWLARQSGTSSDDLADSRPAPEAAQHLREEIYDPNAPIASTGPDAVSNVSFENNFNLELTRLYGDLFTAVERSGSDEVYDLLSDRASALFSMAIDDTQRAEAEKIFEKIKSCRNDPSLRQNVAMGGYLTGQGQGEILYQAPGAGPAVNGAGNPQLIRENAPILFSVPNRQTKEKKDGQKHFGTTDKNGIRFALSNQSGNAKSRPGKPSSIVPPANYAYPAPAKLMVGPEVEGSGKNDAPPTFNAPTSQPEPEGTPTTDETHPSPNEDKTVTFLAESGLPASVTVDPIRPVAVYVQPEDAGQVASPSNQTTRKPATGPAPAGNNGAIQGAPVNAPSQPKGYDVAGTLGYFPNPSGNAPSYALVEAKGGKLVILCYVAPGMGKSLDPFVGKKIGIAGKRGWFKKDGENRKIITVESIHLLGE